MKTRKSNDTDPAKWVVALMKLVKFIVALVKSSKKSVTKTPKN